MKTSSHGYCNCVGSIRRALLVLAVCGVAFLPGWAWGQQVLYVSNSIGGVVDAISPGGVVSAFGSGFDSPTGLAVNSTGTVFVANSGNGTIDEVTPGGVVSTFASFTYSFGGPPSPAPLGGLAFNSAGTLFVATQGGGFTISEVSPAGVESNMITDSKLLF